MKKLIVLLGSLLVFAGIKAQADSMIRKEMPIAVRPSAGDSLRNKPSLTIKQNSPKDLIKKNDSLIMNQKPVLPSKGIPPAMPTKGNPPILPVKQ